jgi:hypothetical protein
MRGLLSANALHHDHSFGIGELIEVKAGRFCRFLAKASTGRAWPETPSSAAGRADRQQRLRARGNLFRFQRLRRPDAFPRTLERRQILFREFGGNAASGHQPVKFRMRQIEIARDLLELGAVYSLQPMQMPPSRDNAAHPAAKAAAAW